MTAEKTGSTNILVIGAAAVVVIAGLKAAEPILIPTLLAVFIAILTIPLVRLMVRYRVPEGLAVAIVLLFLLGLEIGRASCRERV